MARRRTRQTPSLEEPVKRNAPFQRVNLFGSQAANCIRASGP